MPAQVCSYSLPPEYEQAVEDYHVRLGYFYKSDFVQAAIREKFEREEIEVELPAP